EAHRLETFGQGESLLQGALLEELEDKLHFFVEECDYLQVLCDLADGFVGLGSKVTELLQDSYGGRGILTWGMTPVGHRDSVSDSNWFICRFKMFCKQDFSLIQTPFRDLCRLLNCSLGMVHMAAHSSLFCPLTLQGGLGRRPTSPPQFPLLTYDPSLWYHSSSVLALALDALTVSYRLRNNSVPMWQVADLLAVSGRKVVAAYGAIPFPMMSGGSLPDALSACADALPWKPLSACPEAGEGQCYGQLTSLKGFEGQKLISCLAASPAWTNARRYHGNSRGEPDCLEMFDWVCIGPLRFPRLALQLVSSPSKLTPPFPQIFSQSLDAQGFLRSEAPPPGALGPVISSVPVMTSLQSGPALDPWLSELHRATSAFDIRRVAPSFLSQGPEMAEYQEALEELRLLARCYRDDSSGVMRSSSEEEDDD
ncbi:hypothetical protein GOODEAATRI_028796, partial [Goodea atripinnis]